MSWAISDKGLLTNYVLLMQGVFDSRQRDNIKYVYGYRYLPTFGSLFLCILESQGDFKEPSSDRIQLNVLGSLLLIQ